MELPGAVPPLGLPLPEGAGLEHVERTVADVERSMERAERVLQGIKDRLANEARRLPDGFDAEAVADAWHDEHIRPLLLEHVILGDAFSEKLSDYKDAIEGVAVVLSEWTDVASRMDRLVNSHLALTEEMTGIAGEIVYQEQERRH